METLKLRQIPEDHLRGNPLCIYRDLVEEEGVVGGRRGGNNGKPLIVGSELFS